MGRYGGTIKDHAAIKSAKKGTPGIQFEIDLNYKMNGDEWEPIEKITRSIWLYFPEGGDHSISLKKLEHAGWPGGPLSSMDLRGQNVEVVSEMEHYEGKDREKFDFPLPPRGISETSKDAELAIDRILMAAPAPAPKEKKEEPPKEDPKPKLHDPAPAGKDDVPF